MERFVYAVIIMVVGFILGIYNAWLFIDLWKWFVVPLGLPSLTLWAAYGLMLVLQWPLMSLHVRSELASEKEPSDAAATAISRGILLSAAHTVSFWVGWFIQANLL